MTPTDASETQETPTPDEPAQAGESAAMAAQPGEELAKMRDQWLRAVAETENVRKRMQRDVEETGKYAVAGFARDLVNVAENLQRALDSTPAEGISGAVKSLRDGVEMTLRELLSAFERHGIRRLDPMGQKFDHNYHQAVAQMEMPDAEPGTVVQVLQAGYTIHDRLLRPAMVGVARQNAATKIVDTTA